MFLSTTIALIVCAVVMGISIGGLWRNHDVQPTCQKFWEFGCDGRCLNHTTVCDGVRDCPANEDESYCALPIINGSVWVPDIRYDDCSYYQPLNVILRIFEVDTSDIPSYPKIRAQVELVNNRTGEIRSSFEDLSGRYSYANRMLWVTTEIGDGVYMRCVFDGVNTDRCEGALHTAEYTVADWNPCAEFTYWRQH